MIVASVAGGLSENITALLADDTFQGEGKRLANLLLETAVQQGLSLAGSHPDLLTDEAPVQALITSAIRPLIELNDKNQEEGITGLSLDRLQRLRTTLRGPLPLSMLTALRDLSLIHI